MRFSAAIFKPKEMLRFVLLSLSLSPRDELNGGMFALFHTTLAFQSCTCFDTITAAKCAGIIR